MLLSVSMIDIMASCSSSSARFCSVTSAVGLLITLFTGSIGSYSSSGGMISIGSVGSYSAWFHYVRYGLWVTFSSSVDSYSSSGGMTSICRVGGRGWFSRIMVMVLGQCSFQAISMTSSY